MPNSKRGHVSVFLLDDRINVDSATVNRDERAARLRLDQAEYFFVCLDWFASEFNVSIRGSSDAETNTPNGSVIASLSPPQAKHLLKRLLKKLPQSESTRLAHAYGYPAGAQRKIDQARSFIVAALELIAGAKEGEWGQIVYYP